VCLTYRLKIGSYSCTSRLFPRATNLTAISIVDRSGVLSICQVAHSCAKILLRGFESLTSVLPLKHKISTTIHHAYLHSETTLFPSVTALESVASASVTVALALGLMEIVVKNALILTSATTHSVIVPSAV